MSLLCGCISVGVATPQQPGASVPRTGSPAQSGSAKLPIPARFCITGTVINSITKAPVPKAELSASPMTSRRPNGRAAGRASQAAGQTNAGVADEAGHFVIEVPSAGGWSLTASARGHHSQAFDAHEAFSSAIVLTDTAPTYDVTFSLPPAAAIEGYVLDEAGEAVRNAQVTVTYIPPATPDDTHPGRQARGTQRTDDRGYYRQPNLLAGSYELRLQAQPWYATSGPRSSRGGDFNFTSGSTGSGSTTSNANNSSPNTGPDPLDVVYPVLWFPGVADFAAAAPIMLHAGEVREADFRLSPIPGVHLRLPAAGASLADESRRPAIQTSANLSLILPDGSEVGMPTNVRTDALGNSEFSGLAPGTYVVRRQRDTSSAGGASTMIQIPPNSARTIDLSQAILTTPVTIRIDPAADRPSLQIGFRDLENGRITYVEGLQGFGYRSPRRRLSAANVPAALTSDDLAQERHAARSVDLKPGRYEVILSGIDDLHLTSIEATGAAATGRTVTINGGSPALTLHVASGRANITGFVRSHGAAIKGAMILLVPATLGDPSGFDILRRDQSNTDGSFEMQNVLPGTYILVAIENGWNVNWQDPSTLRRFLMRGTPLDLNAARDRSETIEAQLP